MPSADPFTAWGDPAEKEGCAYIVENGHSEPCGAPCALGSSCCPHHHALTHLAHGSKAEAEALRAINAIALAVGGRMGKGGVIGPSQLDLDAIERRSILAGFFRSRRRPARDFK